MWHCKAREGVVLRLTSRQRCVIHLTVFCWARACSGCCHVLMIFANILSGLRLCIRSLAMYFVASLADWGSKCERCKMGSSNPSSRMNPNARKICNVHLALPCAVVVGMPFRCYHIFTCLCSEEWHCFHFVFSGGQSLVYPVLDRTGIWRRIWRTIWRKIWRTIWRTIWHRIEIWLT